jgi:uncharacterized protein (TIGR03437 family)
LINAQMLPDAHGAVAMHLQTPSGNAETSATVSDTAPAVFLVPFANAWIPAIVHLDGRLVSSAAPAAHGEWLAMFLTGLGAVKGTLPPGAPAPNAPLYTTLAAVRVQVDGASAEVNFAGLAPGFVGLNQINFRVPDSAGAAATLRIFAGDTGSASAVLNVRP